VCFHCKKELRKTRKGKLEELTIKHGHYVHIGCRNQSITTLGYDILEKSKHKIEYDYSKTDMNKYNVVRISLSTLELLTSDEEYNDTNNINLDAGEPYRKLQILIIDDKYYAVIDHRSAYMSRENLSRKQIDHGAHYGITWSGDIYERLFYGPVECVPGGSAFGWDYNHYCLSLFPGGVNGIVPLKYIYKNIKNIIAGESDY
jgi:hypothetical protein